jgi:hypothetical protein
MTSENLFYSLIHVIRQSIFSHPPGVIEILKDVPKGLLGSSSVVNVSVGT